MEDFRVHQTLAPPAIPVQTDVPWPVNGSVFRPRSPMIISPAEISCLAFDPSKPGPESLDLFRPTLIKPGLQLFTASVESSGFGPPRRAKMSPKPSVSV